MFSEITGGKEREPSATKAIMPPGIGSRGQRPVPVQQRPPWTGSMPQVGERGTEGEASQMFRKFVPPLHS